MKWSDEPTRKEARMHADRDAADRSLARLVRVHYRNWRGEERTREIVPISLRYGRTDWHPKDQWLLLAVDPEDAQTKEFALKDCDFLHPNTACSQPGKQATE